MSKEKAKVLFLGTQGHKKLNCGQAIIGAFKEKFNVSDATLCEFAKYGGGKAPEGLCGALYAAQVILGKHPDKMKECEVVFLTFAGSAKCKDIRALKKLTCSGCVEKVAQCLEKI
ncbi:MAG: hypothetical protein PHV55_01230 [Candidatus Omnitrophica bacterium]|nr:hypothetical protein [Candidatus Omnitrophota bacterium]